MPNNYIPGDFPWSIGGVIMIIDKNVELFEKAQKGDREAVTSIVEDNIGLVYKQAKKFKGKAISYDDAIQVGSLGLLHSIQNVGCLL